MTAPTAPTPYPSSDLSEREWSILAPLLPPPKPGGRPRAVDVRRILDGIFHVLRSGGQWRLLPHEYGPWSTVYGYFLSCLAPRWHLGAPAYLAARAAAPGAWVSADVQRRD
jgi:transposase